MAEFVFVVKTFFVSCAFIFLMQYPVDGVSAENKIFAFLQNNMASGWLKDAGTGAVRLTASVADRVLPESIKSAIGKKSQVGDEFIKMQQQKMRKQEEAWAKRVDKTVEGIQ